MVSDEEHHNLIGRLIKHARSNAVVGLWDDVFDQLRGLCLLAAVDRRPRELGSRLSNLHFNRDILRDLFQQVSAASCRRTSKREARTKTCTRPSASAESARQEIIDRTRGRLLLMKEGERAALRKLLVGIWDGFDAEQRS